MTRAEEIHEIAEELRALDLTEHQVAAVLELHDQLGDDDEDRGHAAALPRTGGVYDGWPVGTRGEAVDR